jgi:hypothetical protein
MAASSAFLSDLPVDAAVTAAYDGDLASDGYVNNSQRERAREHLTTPGN